jgi:hypothetical protein
LDPAPRCFAIPGLGFGVAFAATDPEDFLTVGCAAALAFAAGCFTGSFFATAFLGFAGAFFAFALTADFLAPGFGSSFLSEISNTGLGSGFSWIPILLISDTGFTPAAIAAFATLGLNDGCLGFPAMSGFTMTWLS